MRFLFIFWLFLVPVIAAAQLFESSDIPPRIQVFPETVRPFSTLTLTLSPTTPDMRDALVTWSRDGVIFARGIGQLSATTSAGALGTRAQISVNLDGVEEPITATLIPADISLLWSAESYVPPFYKGRALPGTRSTLHAEAIPVLTLDGRTLPVNELVFTWSINGSPKPSLSGIGRSRVVIPASLTGTRTIKVVASTKDALLSAETTTTIPSVVPQPQLYREHPLFGTLYHLALPQQVVSPETDLELVIVPYFSDTKNPRSLTYEWSINDAPARISELLPHHIHLNSKGPGSAVLNLTLTNTASILEEAQRQWTVFLGERTGIAPTL